MPTQKPSWFKVKAPGSAEFLQVKQLTRRLKLETVCESASCPNIGHCWHTGSAAFMILGTLCTRSCLFCNLPTGKPLPPDPDEPHRIAQAATVMNLRHVVITSVTRDDLLDGGATQFIACVTTLRDHNPNTTIELLTPDFRGKESAAERVLNAAPEVFNHNIETVPRLYPEVRPGANYQDSLDLLALSADKGTSQTKSGIMLGLGEEKEEVLNVLADLRHAGVTALTIGQYLAPSRTHRPVAHYWPPEAFDTLRQQAQTMGFSSVESHPLARSSLHAQRLFTKNRR